MMKAGKYYVGDLCYVLHEVWDEVCNIIIEGDNCLEGEFNLPDGRRFASFNTYWGDGEYYDQHNRAYSVDAGLIGCILESDIDTNVPHNFTKGGQIIDFLNDFECRNNEGTIIFGRNVYINTYNTDVQKEEDEEDEYEET